MRRLTCAALLLLCLLPDVAMADGKFYTAEKIPPDIPYQRAVVWFSGEREILLLQSRYDARNTPSLRQMGWVVPVPAVPDLASLTTASAEWFFLGLDQATQPETISVQEYLGPVPEALALLFLALPIILLIRLCAAFVTKRLGVYRAYVGSIRQNVVLLVLALAVLVVVVPNLLSAQKRGLQVIKVQEVGDYEVKVIRAEESDDLIRWLNANGFKFEASDREAFTGYINNRWYFVTVKISPRAQLGSTLSRDGLVQPLILRFKTNAAVYPLALTGTAKEPTELLLYVFHQHRMDASGRLTMKFANQHKDDFLVSWLKDSFEPEGVFDNEKFDEPFLTKFSGRLTPEQMRSDLLFKRTPNDEPYRERAYAWSHRAQRLPRQPVPPLIDAVEKGDRERVLQLIANGANVNRRYGGRWIPLYSAVATDRVEVASLLIEKGANANLADHEGDTLLHYAARRDSPGSARLLIEKGAKIDVRNKHSETPLHTALRLINPKVAKVLIENGADVNATTSNGLTPLHLAGDREVAELLLARGAKIDVKDASGKTPLDQAIALNRTEVVRLLRARQIKD